MSSNNARPSADPNGTSPVNVKPVVRSMRMLLREPGNPGRSPLLILTISRLFVLVHFSDINDTPVRRCSPTNRVHTAMHRIGVLSQEMIDAEAHDCDDHA